jgi:hypothetical protein
MEMLLVREASYLPPQAVDLNIQVYLQLRVRLLVECVIEVAKVGR